MNTKQTEALKLAREALKELRMLGMNMQWHDSWLAKSETAITAIREALAEQEQRWAEFNETTKKNIEHAEWYLSTHPAQQQEPSDRFKDFPTNDWGEPIIYDTNEIDEITGFLTGDEGEEDSVTVLHNLVRYLNVVHPGKTMTQVLIETEEAALAAQQQEPVACKTLCELCVKRGYRFCANAARPTPIPSPPASKPWVGLTDEDIQKIWRNSEHMTVNQVCRAIEAKLREKNA